MLINEDKLSLISSKYILKSIFYHLDYNHLLKVFKNNKSFQNKIGITLDNYKLQSNFPEYNYVRRVNYETLHDFRSERENERCDQINLGKVMQYCCLLTFTVIYSIFVLIYTILLIAKDTFNESTAQGDYKNKAYIINVINYCNFILSAANIVAIIILCYYGINSDEEDNIIDYYTKPIIILIILYDLLFFSYEGIAIWKLVLSYQIKKDGAFWFIVMDYIFIFVNLLYIILIFYLSFIFFIDNPAFIKYNDEEYSMDYYLVSLNNIEIDNYILSKSFLNMDEKGRKQVLLNNYKNMKYKINTEEEDVIEFLNDFRKKNNLYELSEDRIKNIPECFMKQYTEVEINKDENVFKLNNNLYLFKLLEGEFEEKLRNNDLDSDMYDVLRSEKLNHVKIIKKNDFEYIFFFKLSYMELLENDMNEKY